MNFEEKVKNLSAKEIILLMTEAIKNPVIKLNFNTFGVAYNNVCYGCAATNLVCKISDKVFDVEHISCTINRAKFIDCNFHFLDDFENAIDRLRQGSVFLYNSYTPDGVAQIKAVEGLVLPPLDNSFRLSDLEPYLKLAEAQD